MATLKKHLTKRLHRKPVVYTTIAATGFRYGVEDDNSCVYITTDDATHSYTMELTMHEFDQIAAYVRLCKRAAKGSP